jgi:asparagine synthase (glutamine-hydrolysing)
MENSSSLLTGRYTTMQSFALSIPPYKFKTHSDCEVIIPLVCLPSPLDFLSSPLMREILQYKKYGKELCGMLDGMFSFVLLDESVTPTRVIAARDPIGITTLYQGRASSKPGVVMFASELKALPTECDEIISFPPGHLYDSQTDAIERYFKPTWWDTDHDDKIPTSPANLENLRKTLELAVKKRLMSEVPYGVLLSGGLDSSLIAAIAARETEKVAQAQAEVRRKKLAEASSGPGTPTKGAVSEYGTMISVPA